MRTADLIRRQAAALVEPHGITLQQFNVLRILRGAGGDGLPTLEVAERDDRADARRHAAARSSRSQRSWFAGSAARRIGGSICAGLPTKGLALLEKIDTVAPRAHEESLKGLRQKDRVDVHPAAGCDPRRASVAVF